MLRRLLLSLLILHFISKSVVASETGENNYTPPPIIEHDLSLITTQDTYAKEQVWYGLPYNSRYILLGYDSVYKHMRTRPQLGFDLTQLNGIESDDIYKAYLTIWNWRPLNPNPYNIKIYPITQNWNERTVDWNNQPQVGEYHNLQHILPMEGWQYFDVTNIIKEFANDEEMIYGFALHKDLENEFGAYYCSSNYLVDTIIDDGCSSETVPQLIIQLNKAVAAPVIELTELAEDEFTISKINEFDYEISFELSTSLDQSFETSVVQSNSSGEFLIVNLLPGDYFYRMRAKYRDRFSEWSNILNIEIIEELQDEFPEVIPPDKDPNDKIEEITADEEDQTADSVEAYIQNSLETKEVLNPTIKEVELYEDFSNIDRKTIDIIDRGNDVLGIRDSFYNCKIIYNTSKKTAQSPWCKIPKLNITSIKSVAESTQYTLSIIFNNPSPINILYEEVECKSKSILDPKTWFQCIEQTTFSKGYYQTANYSGSLYISAKSKSFLISPLNENKLQGKILSNSPLTKQKSEFKQFVNFSFKPRKDIWIDISRKVSNEVIQIPASTTVAQNSQSEKPFGLMLDIPVSVTQWHGNTSFQQPHHGIDFLVADRSLYAIGNGVIEAKVWDTFGGDCNSGGYALRIKHDNGMHSVYMHLMNDLDSSITGLKVGDKVVKGDFVAVSSNTGYYNCQPLSSHLHFELRKGRLQSTHVDPVSYIAANWDEIATKDYKTNPGRLTGDNPHPGR